MFASECGIERFVLHFLYHMRYIEITAIGDCRTEVGYLQRSEVYLALADTDTYDSKAVP